MKFTSKQASDGQWYWTAIARNGHVTAGARGYNSDAGCRRAARAFVRACQKIKKVTFS